MNYKLLLLLVLLISNSLLAQRGNNELSEPYPAPVGNESLSYEKAAFLALFEDKNVGNMHVFTTQKKKKASFFKGVMIHRNYRSYFPLDTWKSFRRKKTRPEAVFSIRGDGEEWYIIRVSDKKHKNTLRLYEFNQDKLVEKMLLAEVRCKGKNCDQTDSWIRDIDGDTRLDIIQRTAKIDKKGNVKSSEIKAYSINNMGVFKENKALTYDPNDYQLEKVKLK